ncbi:AAA family ATPase [Paracoccus sp. MBLB3053]|uniref:AAA family ATPase n=1 Tax=Paracoccus aurantius TaxID=3073814 RepID=A0ABU2HWJ6_9RHOB|nr:AAA family ATPase [Paracoccus sp. MBLB3053]MDS9469418.1 AAA family ATPase [Paracoccus sp. MBLB3053]
MKIRAIELTNVRRFAGRKARIDQISDGITVLSEPNEFGKSTFFDALHALFFERHRGTKQAVKSLQPHSAGAPEVAIEIDLPQGWFRIEKRWLSRATARVLDAHGRILAQDDEAEAWIDQLLGNGLAGPTGLLWVRQGLLGLEPEGTTASDKNERERGLKTRRDLLSSVAGEIDTMTGGRRLDKVLSRVGHELGRLATSTQKPKAGGEWARAAEELASLRSRETELAAKAANLSESLARRSEINRQLRELNDQDAERARKDALTKAQDTQAQAIAHADRLSEAQKNLRLAHLTMTGTADEITRLEKLSLRLSAAEDDTRQATAKAAESAARAKDLAAADRAAAEQFELARNHAVSLRNRLAAAQRGQLAQSARLRCQQLEVTLGRAEELRREIEANRAFLALCKVTPERVQGVEAARELRDRLQAQIEAQSVHVSLRYEGASRVHDESGAAIEGVVQVTAARSFRLPGIGTMVIDPGRNSAETLAVKLADAETKLAAKLDDCGCSTIAEARQKLAEVERIERANQTCGAMLDQIAPEGLDQLRQEIAITEARATLSGTELEAPEEIEAVLEAATQVEDETRNLATEAHLRAIRAGEERAAGQSAQQAAARTLEDFQAEAGDVSELGNRLNALRAALVSQIAHHREAEAIAARLRDCAPDQETIGAALARARSVVEQANASRDRLRNEQATLNGSIGALADQGIEEELNEIRGRLEASIVREQRYATEVHALARLRTALEDARRSARDSYFAPVMRELTPLLALIHPDAELRIDDQSLLPAALTRMGQIETLDILSGGTREQIAILTRLAFARLLSRSGQPVPVILDDALVHSDDERIEAMFTALHRAARDQQVLVLTCRQRAFAALGGERAHAEITAI